MLLKYIVFRAAIGEQITQNTNVSYRCLKPQPVQQEPTKIRTMYEQAECTQVDQSEKKKHNGLVEGIPLSCNPHSAICMVFLRDL